MVCPNETELINKISHQDSLGRHHHIAEVYSFIVFVTIIINSQAPYISIIAYIHHPGAWIDTVNIIAQNNLQQHITHNIVHNFLLYRLPGVCVCVLCAASLLVLLLSRVYQKEKRLKSEMKSSVIQAKRNPLANAKLCLLN